VCPNLPCQTPAYRRRLRSVDGNEYIETAWPYMQLAAELRPYVAKMKPHQMLPSNHHLAHDFGHAPKTVRKALKILESEGLVYVRPNKGTYVAPR
jgi:DNA-binding GntR family transcriptional regulator